MEFMNVERQRKMREAKIKANYKRAMASERAKSKKLAKKRDWVEITIKVTMLLTVAAYSYYAWFIY